MFLRKWLRPAALERERHRALEIAAAPVHLYHRASVRERPILEVEGGARALKQGLGDEKAEPQPARLERAGLALRARALPWPAGDIGLADPVHDLRGEAGAVVGDGDGDVLAAPGGRHLDPRAREIDGVFE